MRVFTTCTTIIVFSLVSLPARQSQAQDCSAVWQNRRFVPNFYSANLAYDSRRGVTIQFGGALDGFYYWNYPLEWDGRNWTVGSFDPNALLYRQNTSMTFDSRRGVTVLFGGYSVVPQEHGLVASTWEYDGVARRKVATDGPPARQYGAMAFDERRGVTVLFGGSGISNTLGDLWEWDGLQWTRRTWTGDGPPPISNPGLAYHAGLGGVVTYWPFGAPVARLWSWDGSAWTLQSTTGPLVESGNGIAYDADRGLLVLAVKPDATRGGTYEWDGINWFRRTTDSKNGNSFIYDSRRGRCISCLLGGTGEQIWEWDGQSWTQPTLNVPPARSFHALTYDALRQQTVVFGGTNIGLTYKNDTWIWNGETWTQLQPQTSPNSRQHMQMVFADCIGQSVLFGGLDALGLNAETWLWDGANWSQLPISGPSARSDYGLSYDSIRGVVVLFGGKTAVGDNAETWEFDGLAWTQIQVSGPSPRSRFTMTFDSGHAMSLLTGGPVSGNETWGYDGTQWFLLDASAPLDWLSAMTYDSGRNRAIAHRDSIDQTWEWNGIIWSQTAYPLPEVREGAAATYDRDRHRVVEFGGTSQTGHPLSETWEYGPNLGPADVNCDSRIDISDLATALIHYAEYPAFPDQGDLNQDGLIDLGDIAALLANFGQSCP